MPKLTKRVVDGLSPQTEKHYITWDDEIKGFGVRVMPTGRKTYFFRYRVGMKDRKIKIGVHGSLTVEQARIRAKDLSSKVALGRDPSEEKPKKQYRPTMQDLAHEYLEKHGPKKRERSLQEDKDMLKKHILPTFATRKVQEMTKRDIEGLHARMKDTPFRANRILSLLSMMFNLAVSWEWRENNPTHGIKRYHEPKRERWLDEDEIARLLQQLDAHPLNPCAHALKLLLLTGARKNEVLKVRWDHLDLEGGFWMKPARNTKQNKFEYIPLSPEALAFLKDIKRYAVSGYVCPGRIANEPLKEPKKFWRQIITQAQINNVRINDLRHTFASHLVSDGQGLLNVSKLLGHSQVATTQRYAHLANRALQITTNAFGEKVRNISNKKVQPLTVS